MGSLQVTIPNFSTTWASRNPGLDVQPIRVRLSENKSDAADATLKLKALEKRKNAERLEDYLTAYLDQQQRFIEDTAKEFGVEQVVIQKKILHATTYVKQRKVSLQNALVHHKRMEVNEGEQFL